MIRCIRKLFTLAVVLVLLAAFGYSVVFHGRWRIE